MSAPSCTGLRPLDVPHPSDCFGCGAVENGGLGARIACDDERIVVDFTPLPPHSGWPQHLHGGILATLFDEALGTVAQEIVRLSVVTGTLTTVFRSRAVLREPVRVTAWLDRIEGRKVLLAGEAHAGDRLLAEATGTWILVDDAYPGLE